MYSLYSRGYTHVVDGVQCQLIRVEERDLESYRALGWVDDVHSLNKPAEPEKAEKKTRGKNKPADAVEVKSEAESTEGNKDDLQDEKTDS